MTNEEPDLLTVYCKYLMPGGGMVTVEVTYGPDAYGPLYAVSGLKYAYETVLNDLEYKHGQAFL